MKYFTYVLRSRKDNSLYIGISKSPESRLKEHNWGDSKFTKGRRPYSLIYKEEFIDRVSARKREKYLKSGIGREYLKRFDSPVAQLVERVAVSRERGKEVALARVDTRKYSSRRLYLIDAVRKRRKRIRQMAIEYKGSCCEKCGYNRCIEALEFHHRDSSGKDFSISERGYTRSWIKVKEELDKCILLCANCHREIHAQIAASARNRG